MSTKETPRQMLPSPIRTQGDGMENASETKGDSDCVKQEKNFLGDKLIYRPSSDNHFTPSPPVITGKIVNLIPKNVTQSRKDKILLGSLKGKEPKFVPYEPYKAAVKPIIPHEKKNRPGDKKQSSKVVDMKLMVHALPVVKDVNPEEIDELHAGEEVLNNDERKEWESEIKSLKEEILLLREENGQLESQLKFQAQVNGELKNLLVAAVGEDLETRMHLLTEDKLQLARALLNSAQRLSTHQEQTEWLAGQCEVWRSKFLASSLMVEELARWKAALCQKVTDLQEALKRLLEERNKVRESLLNTYRNLSTLRDNFDINTIGSRRSDLRTTNILDLAAGNLLFSEALRISLLGSKEVKKKMPDFTGLDTTTCAEKIAENLLANPTPLLLPDAACSAVMGAAVAVGGQMLLRPSLPTCCSHCSGEVKLV